MAPVPSSHPIRLRPAEAAAPVARAPEGGLRLQLSVSRAGLGLESATGATLGPLRLDALSTTLPGLSFPVDLSGGVTRFRHRRGDLSRLVVTCLREPLSRALERRIAPDGGAELTLLPRDGGVTVGVATRDAALAFDVVWAPIDGRARVVVERARAVGLAMPAHQAALGALDAAVKGLGARAGSVAWLDDVAGQVLRAALPLIGARAPSTAGAVLSSLSTSAEGFRFVAETDASPPRLDAAALAALETAELCATADDALLRGDHGAARQAYLRALELAPHHGELARRLAELDHAAGDRAEAALSTLALAGPVLDAGALGGAVLADSGDARSARAAYESAAHREPFGPLAARCLAAAAALADDPSERLSLLSSAVARAPTSASLRGLRLDAALARGDVTAALAEASHLEAAGRGPDEKQRALLDAARAFAARGAAGLAAPLVERALRYRPTDEDALVLLAEALRALGRHARAADVLSRALALAERRRATRHDAAVALASLLLDELSELPLAVARARTVPLGAVEHARARWIEGRALARLGDRAAASLAFTRMRDALAATGASPDDAARWLDDAATFEEQQRGDLHAARAHLAAALSLAPRDRAVVSRFRALSAELSRPSPVPARAPDPRPEREIPASVDPADGWCDDDERARGARDDARSLELAEPSSETGDADAEARVEHLTASVRADPSRLDVVIELAALLERLGRDLELFALLSARLEEGDDDTRAALAPRARATLERLAAAALARGSDAEAKLYAELAATLR